MVRVCRSVVVRSMAAGAGVGRVGVISLVAGKTIARDGCMSPGKGIYRCMIEGRWYPSSRGMTGLACSREVGRDMVWVGGRVVFRNVAACAGIGRVHIASLVTFGAIGCDGRMGTGKRIHVIVVEVRRGPGCL